jgi:hypothetical protein
MNNKIIKIFLLFFIMISSSEIYSKDKTNVKPENNLAIAENEKSLDVLTRPSNLKNYEPECYLITRYKRKESGFIALEFRNYFSVFNSTNKTICPENIIYNANTNPEHKIRGSNGINGRVADQVFELIISPEATEITIQIKKNGELKEEKFNIAKEIQKLIEIEVAANTLPSWKSALTNSESQLAEKAKLDKTPPTIKIDSPELKDNLQYKTDSYTVLIRGKITDSAGVLKTVVAGKSVGLDDNGMFTSKVKLGYGKNEILIQAEDINGNVSEKKIIITRQEIVDDSVAQDIDIPIKGKQKKSDSYAVVIGIEKYQYVPDAIHANNDAEVFREYLIDTLGYPKENIKIITDRKATQAEIDKLLGTDGWLARNAIKNKSDVVVYFSGHGIANFNTLAANILPYDVDPNYSSGIQLKSLYKNLASLDAKSMTVYLDACFTGQTRNEKLLIDKARPIVIKEADFLADEKITVVSASTGSQISSAMSDSNHGIFTYYLLKGLRGDADKNKDKRIYLDELIEYISKEVKTTASKMGRVQTPVVSGTTKILLVDSN